jgi:hypothetical protein
MSGFLFDIQIDEVHFIPLVGCVSIRQLDARLSFSWELVNISEDLSKMPSEKKLSLLASWSNLDRSQHNFFSTNDQQISEPFFLMNHNILTLLETLEEYLQVQAALQGFMSDGYMELARIRRSSTGLLVPEVIVSPNRPCRMVSSDQNKLTDIEVPLFVSGIAEGVVESTRTEFTKAIQEVMRLVIIRKQCLEKLNAVKMDLSNR